MKVLTLSALFLGLASAQLAAIPIILEIAPDSKSCQGELAGTSPDECRTAEQAAPWIAASMSKYNIYHINEMAAIVALIVMESTQFKYKRNINPAPGLPGKGTSNMQSPSYNLQYANSIDALKDKVKDMTEADMAIDTGDTSKKNRMLDLLVDDQYTFASGSWFYSTICKDDVKQLLKEDADKGFERYMLECVEVPKVNAENKPDPNGGLEKARLVIFERAKTAFGVKSS